LETLNKIVQLGMGKQIRVEIAWPDRNKCFYQHSTG
jgi:hypothetical protein